MLKQQAPTDITGIIYLTNGGHLKSFIHRIILSCKKNQMNLYKILFENNQPVSAHLLDGTQHKTVKIDSKEGKRSIKWITIRARDEEDGINVANEVIRGISDLL
jgi:hypothetical protein